MKTRYKHIYFEQEKTPPGRKTEVWAIRNIHSGQVLGQVRWYGPWRQYCSFFDTLGELVYAASCHRDTADFLEQLMAARKPQPNARLHALHAGLKWNTGHPSHLPSRTHSKRFLEKLH